MILMNTRTVKDHNMMRLLRCPFFAEAQFNFRVAASHINGSINTAADMLSRNLLLFPTSLTHPHSYSSSSTGHTTGHQCRLAIPPLVKSAERYFAKSLSTASQKSYAAGTKRYLDFCSSSLSLFPVSEVNLSSFMSFLADQGLKHQTLKCYLSAIRSAQIAHGYTEPNFSSFPHLVAILNGIKRVQAESHISPHQRLPITPDILAVIHRFLPDDRAGHMVWAACLTGFFGFLRTAEFTVPTANQYDPSVHLRCFYNI